MKKFFALQLTLVFVCICSITAYAQDSAKKANPVKPIVKPYGAAKAPGYYYHAKYPVKPAAAPGQAVAGTTPADTATAAKPDAPTDKSLNGQYQYLLTKVYYYQQPLIGAFHKSIMDSLNQARHALKVAKDSLALQNKTIDSLHTSIKTDDATLSESNSKDNSISLLGIAMDKDVYSLIMWGVVIILAIITFVVVSRSGSSSKEAKYRMQLYNELEEEFKAYKAKANEKEKKLARELQTERNKLDDLLGKS
jgi:hypothetical protein